MAASYVYPLPSDDVPGREAVPDGWMESDMHYNAWIRDAGDDEPLVVTLFPHGYETGDGQVGDTLAEACAAAERAYCGAYVGAPLPHPATE